MRDALRVLVLTADYVPTNWSGIGVAVEAQATGLARAGAELDVVWVSPRPVAAQAGAVRVHVQHQDGVRFAVDPSRFDLVHLHSLALSELACELRRRFDLPLVYSSHSVIDSELDSGRVRAFWSEVQRELFRVCDRVVFPSDSERELALESRSLPGFAGRAVVVPNGLETRRRLPAAALPDAPILFAGRWTRQKGLALLERLVPRLTAGTGRRFFVAGGHGDAEGNACIARMQALAGERCSVLGWCSREKLDELYRHAALTVIPSEYEPFGMIALEAMRCGCPVLARATGGLSEILGPGSGGRLVRGDDPALWEAEVTRLLANPELLRALASAGPEYVRARYSVDRVARLLISRAYLPALARYRERRVERPVHVGSGP